MKLRPARTMRFITSQAWSRYSVKKPKKNYVKALPHTSLLIYRMGNEEGEYDMHMTLNADQYVQVRSNALEAARQTANKYLEKELQGNYFFRIITVPHQVIREKKRATGAGADRLSQGMSMSFGKPVSVAARLKQGQAVLEIKTRSESRAVAKEALRRASSKLSGTYTIKTMALN
ncbi:MAG: 50S ribosomal protein L16 [Candidatus Marsarchaeota archaeon]|jgi:large subunit ribosomal protein L10e|nr:50S ribosomal protein L16 [Candidatus Marsarchaeota archaeon]